jgi:hypothetical protein
MRVHSPEQIEAYHLDVECDDRGNAVPTMVPNKECPFCRELLEEPAEVVPGGVTYATPVPDRRG